MSMNHSEAAYLWNVMFRDDEKSNRFTPFGLIAYHDTGLMDEADTEKQTTLSKMAEFLRCWADALENKEEN